MHHNLDHIRAAMPWAPLPADFDGMPRVDAHPDYAAWHIGVGVYVSYSGDAEWSSVQLSLGDVRVALHHAPGNTEPWAASYWRRLAETIPIVSGATPAEAVRAATHGVELPPTLVNRIVKLIQHVTPEPLP